MGDYVEKWNEEHDTYVDDVKLEEQSKYEVESNPYKGYELTDKSTFYELENKDPIAAVIKFYEGLTTSHNNQSSFKIMASFWKTESLQSYD